MPMTTEPMAMMGCSTMRRTPLVYFSCTLPYAALNDAWKRSMNDILRFEPSSFFGFSRMAQRAGERVRALMADMMMDMAMVIPNSR